MPQLPEKVHLIELPTPLQRLSNLSSEMGIDLWIKRDDLTGFAMGGNKGRKLEFLIADALRQQADVVISLGASESNFLRQLAAAAAKYGLKSAAAVMALPYYAGAGKPDAPYRTVEGGANFLLDRLFGMDVRLYPDADWDQLEQYAEELIQEYERKGLRVYKMPLGGSSLFGAFSFYQAAIELMTQTETPFDTIVTASSSGSTHSGLTYAFAGTNTKVIGISADPDPDDELKHDVFDLITQLGELLGDTKGLTYQDVDLRMDYCLPAYAIPSESGCSAIRRMARSEGILLDPTYSGKAFAGLLDLYQRGELGKRVLFWHTGGAVGLFATPPKVLLGDS